LTTASLPPIDYAAEADRIAASLRAITQQLRRRGLVVAMSGGIDSSVCAALAVRALGANNVYGLLLPERDSTLGEGSLGALLARHLGIRFERKDISSALEALGCYDSQLEVLRRVVPGYGEGWRFKLAIASAMGGKVSVTRVVAQDPSGNRHEARLAAADYQQIVAATNFKQRVRKTLEYYHADRLHYAVVGTPNRLEYDQGFFVKLGDGAADVKPIAHLYKTQVYGMARHLGLPDAITSTTPTTDTFSLAQGQDEFYFGLPYPQMDLVLWHVNEGLGADSLAAALGCDVAAAKAHMEAVHAKRRTTAYLHAPPELVVEVPGIPAQA
jgi:NAD+ synthase